MKNADEWALAELEWHWGDCYVIEREPPGWRARRRDGKGEWLTAPDAEALYAAISADYRADPMPRDLLPGMMISG